MSVLDPTAAGRIVSPPEPFIKLEDVFYAYPRSKTWALRGISLEIEEGEFLAVMGENGAGKTTFCRLFNGLVPHSQGGTLRGTVRVGGRDTRRTPPPVLARGVGMALDDPEIQLFTATVRDEAAFGPENLLVPPDEIEERVRRALEMTGLAAYADFPSAVLSGGQKQRLAVAAALAQADRALVLDEPSSQLDPSGAGELLALIRRIHAERRLTVILATHHSEEAAACADRICVLKNGIVAACDTPRAIFADHALLRDNWIRPPEVSELAHYLERRSAPLPFVPVLPEEARAAVNQWYRNR
jgi:energy-coupling factor transporter ATP-binding protein EcfA2